MGIIRYGRTAQIGVYPGNQSGRFISYRSGGPSGPPPPLGSDTTLWYDFATDKSLAGRLGPTLDFTRNSPATFVNAQGLIEPVGLNVPRFDHDLITGESLGLLIEEPRTNLCEWSEDFTQAGWAVANATITPDSGTTPIAGVNATRLADNNIGGFGQVRVQRQVIGLSPDTSHIMGFFAKADAPGQADFLGMAATNHGGQVIEAWFNLRTGLVGNKSVDVVDHGMIPYRDDWYLCWLRITADAVDTSATLGAYACVNDSGLTSNRDGTSSLFIVGARTEPGAFVSSYIPTTNSVSPRAADTCSTTDVTWYDPTQGTYYVKAKRANNIAAGFGRVFSHAQGSQDHNLCGTLGGGTLTTVYRRANSNLATPSSPGVIVDSTYFKLATAFRLDDFAQYVDGGNAAFDNLGDPNTGLALDKLSLGYLGYSNSQYWNGHVAEFSYANVRLPNGDLQAVTS